MRMLEEHEYLVALIPQPRYEQLFKAKLPISARAAARFWNKVDKNGPGGCWLWTGRIASSGYGEFTWRDGRYRIRPAAHRVAYELSIGLLPKQLVIDHRCHNADKACPGGRSCLHRRCVRPDHLEPTDNISNILRGVSPPALNRLKTSCANGHEFTPDNTMERARGWRGCRTCQQASQKRTYAKHREEILERRRLRRKAAAVDTTSGGTDVRKGKPHQVPPGKTSPPAPVPPDAGHAEGDNHPRDGAA
jgi:HNH endonuclease